MLTAWLFAETLMHDMAYGIGIIENVVNAYRNRVVQLGSFSFATILGMHSETKIADSILLIGFIALSSYYYIETVYDIYHTEIHNIALIYLPLALHCDLFTHIVYEYVIGVTISIKQDGEMWLNTHTHAFVRVCVCVSIQNPIKCNLVHISWHV